MAVVDMSRLACIRYVVVELRGELDLTGAADAATAVRTAGAGGRRVIVNLAGLEFIDCSALNALLQARTAIRQAGGDMLLAAPRRTVQRLLALTGLDEVFGVLASVAAAIDSAVAPPGRAPRQDSGRPGMAAGPPRSPFSRADRD